jgi:GTP pyrophosphokinase
MRDEYKGPRYDAIAGMPFEIQVRTILMDAWANVSHYLDYKSDIDVPKALRRDFYALSGLFYIADSHFELFFKSSKDSSKQMTELAIEGKTSLVLQEVNLDSLRAYLRTRLLDRKHANPKAVSALVRQLSRGGFTTIQQVDAVLEKTADAFSAFEADHPPHPSGRFSDVGVVRVSNSIIDDKYNELVLKDVGAEVAPYDEKYKSLVKKE